MTIIRDGTSRMADSEKLSRKECLFYGRDWSGPAAKPGEGT
jgi:hypothetical protein